MNSFILILVACTVAGCVPTNSAPPTREGYLEFEGRRIWYRIVGADRPGVPILMLHGGPGAPHDYMEPLEALADRRPVIMYDQLGCGLSDRPEDTSIYTPAYFVRELAKVRECLQLSRVHILGQSWGAMLAMEYMATANPAGVVSLTLTGPCLSARMWEEDQKAYVRELPDSVQAVIRDAEATGRFDAPGYQDAMNMYYKLHVCRLPVWPDCVNRAFEKFGMVVYRHMWGPSEFTCTGTLRTFDRTASLAAIRVPTLYTCGQYDEATPATVGKFHDMTPGSELLVIPDASHMHHIEKPDAYLAALRDFLDRADSRSK